MMNSVVARVCSKSIQRATAGLVKRRVSTVLKRDRRHSGNYRRPSSMQPGDTAGVTTRRTSTAASSTCTQRMRRMSTAQAPDYARLAQLSAAEKHKTYLIVGLGNHSLPNTRHSVGMKVVDKFAEYLDLNWTRDAKNCVGFVANAHISDNVDVVLLKPKMPMNVNGTSVARTASYFDVDPENVYLVHDDIGKALGNVGMKDCGSACGHNGVRSVMNSLRTDEIPRIRVGIDRPPSKDQVRDYVLGDFTASENESLTEVVDSCLETLADHIGKRTGVEMREPFHLPSKDL